MLIEPMDAWFAAATEVKLLASNQHQHASILAGSCRRHRGWMWVDAWHAFSRGGSALAWLCNGKEYTEAKDRILRIAPALIIFPSLVKNDGAPSLSVFARRCWTDSTKRPQWPLSTKRIVE